MSIKSLAECPCPRCFVKKDQIGDMGTKLDTRRHENKRINNDDRRAKIEMTWGWIFEKGYGVLSKAVQRVLVPMSLVLTRVCIQVSIPS
jgi:hypothetical protein